MSDHYAHSWFANQRTEEGEISYQHYQLDSSASPDGQSYYANSATPRTTTFQSAAAYPTSTAYPYQGQQQYATSTTGGQWGYTQTPTTHQHSMYAGYTGADTQYNSLTTANSTAAMATAGGYGEYSSPTTTSWTPEQLAAYTNTYSTTSPQYSAITTANPLSINYLTTNHVSPSMMIKEEVASSPSSAGSSSVQDTLDDGDDGKSPSSGPEIDNAAASQIPAATTKTVNSKQVFGCPFPGCVSASKRKADYQRHYACVHARHLITLHECPIARCHRTGREGFTRKDHLIEHLRQFHHHDIPKKKGGQNGGGVA